VGRVEADVVDASVTQPAALGADEGGVGSYTGGIGTGVAILLAVQRLVLGDAGDRDRRGDVLRRGHPRDGDGYEAVIRREHDVRGGDRRRAVERAHGQ